MNIGIPSRLRGVSPGRRTCCRSGRSPRSPSCWAWVWARKLAPRNTVCLPYFSRSPLNSAEGSPLSTGLQNRACQFPGTRLLSDIALVMSTSCRGYVPVHVIVADEMQEFQVVEPVVLVVTVFMVDFCLLLHGEEQSAVPKSSALMLEEFSSGCVQSDVRSFSCAPVAPVAIIRAYSFAQSSIELFPNKFIVRRKAFFGQA